MIRRPLGVKGVPSSPQAPLPLGIAIGFVDERVEVSLSGAMDAATAPFLASLLGAISDAGHAAMTLDVGEVVMIDGAGARVVGQLAAHLRASDEILVVRSAAPGDRRQLELAGVGAFGAFESRARTPSVNQVLVPPANSPTAPIETTAAMEHPHHVVDASLRLVTDLAHAVITGADGVSVSLHRRGALTTVAATDDTIAQMDRDQYGTGQGPCLSAAAEGQAFEIESLAEETRWPDFVPRAVRGGISSILSTPLVTPGGTAGALNIYSHTARAFGPRERELASVFAHQASGVLVPADDGASQVDDRLHRALLARQVIAQAQGVLMARLGTTPELAYAALLRSSRKHKRPLWVEATSLIRSTVSAKS